MTTTHRALAIALVVAAAVVLYAVPPGGDGPYPPCPFSFATGLHCPGCGSLRSIHALMHGHVAVAVGQNALTVAMLAVLSIAAVRQWRRAGSTADLAAGMFAGTSPTAIRALAVIVCLFWIARNVDVPPLDWLAPD